jgi:hypothetical protein
MRTNIEYCAARLYGDRSFLVTVHRLHIEPPFRRLHRPRHVSPAARPELHVLFGRKRASTLGFEVQMQGGKHDASG